jgi:beta-galactosidase
MATDAPRVPTRRWLTPFAALRCGAALAAALMAGCASRVAVPGQERAGGPARQTVSFDGGWRFLQADAPGAEQPGFDDSRWRTLDLPHDWSIAGPFDPRNPTGGAGGFLPAGVGWYRKGFAGVSSDPARRTYVEFDGVMANSDVWINGFHLGHRPYGYVSFAYELTGHLNASGTGNILAVRADDSDQPASRWYSGAGIYRHVRLVVEDPVHMERDATFVCARDITAARAVVRVRTTVMNQSGAAASVSIRVTLRGPHGGTVGSAPAPGPVEIGAGRSAAMEADVVVAEPVRWDVDQPSLYQALVQVEGGGRILDEETVSFGIRDARFEADTGFWLNGRNLKIKGVCVHGDGSAFGAAVPLGVWERRLAGLKRLGVNAIRTAHNPPDPGFLDLCDRMGFLVMDEMFDCWTVAKNPYDYHLYFNDWSKEDTRDTVRRDRNHPSIILWSAGNEIHDTPRADLSKTILSGLVGVFHDNDPTRPVTQALFRPNVSHDYDDGLAALLDVVGTNYRNSELLAAHATHPQWRIIGTEMGQGLDVWRYLRDNPPLSGQFLWVGIDYLGESPRWPYIGGGGDQSGLLDRTGSPRPAAFQRQSWWSAVPMVHIARRIAPEALLPADPGYGNPPRRRPAVLLSDWSPRSTAPHLETVEVYTNTDGAELFLNGRSLGAKPRDPGDAPLVWHVPFEPGVLKAVASAGGRVAATHELRTAGKAARILLEAELSQLAPGWDETDYVRATIVDAQGVPVPGADDAVTFHVDGPGEIAAVDSADNASHEAFQGTQRRAYKGRCFAVVRATAPVGRIALSATAAGLEGGQLTIGAAEAPQLNGRVPLGDE